MEYMIWEENGSFYFAASCDWEENFNFQEKLETASYVAEIKKETYEYLSRN
jgi:hypothetical protein